MRTLSSVQLTGLAANSNAHEALGIVLGSSEVGNTAINAADAAWATAKTADTERKADHRRRER